MAVTAGPWDLLELVPMRHSSGRPSCASLPPFHDEPEDFFLGGVLGHLLQQERRNLHRVHVAPTVFANRRGKLLQSFQRFRTQRKLSTLGPAWVAYLVEIATRAKRTPGAALLPGDFK